MHPVTVSKSHFFAPVHPVAVSKSHSFEPDKGCTFAKTTIGEAIRSCLEFISEDIQEMFLWCFVSSFDEHSELPVKINDETKGQKQAPIEPK